MKLIKFISLVLLMAGLSSCFGDTNNTITQEFTNYCITHVQDSNGGTITTSGTSYKLVTNVDKGTMTMEINNLRLPNNTNINLVIQDQSYGFSTTGATTLNVPSYTSIANGTTHTVTNFKMEYYNRYLNNQSYPILVLSYTVDLQYDVRVIYNPSYYWGTTTVTDENGNTFSNSEVTSFYGIQFNTETHKAIFGAFGAKFAEGMAAVNMQFNDLTYDTNTYNYVVTGNDITPLIGDTPYPSFKISDFRLEGIWGGNQYLSFKCTIDSEKVKGVYNVRATLYIIPPTVENQ